MNWLALTNWVFVAGLALGAARTQLVSLGGQAILVLAGLGAMIVLVAGGASAWAREQRLYYQLEEMLADVGMHHGHLLPHHAYLKNDIPVAGVPHQAGTCRFGSDRASSVLNADCRVHELDNLCVVDTSFFPSIGAVNPALTAMANAVRVGDHLMERMDARQPESEPAHVA